jgi:hypothetical protein
MSGKDEEVSLRDEIMAAYKDENAKEEDDDVSNEEVINRLEAKDDVKEEPAEEDAPKASKEDVKTDKVEDKDEGQEAEKDDTTVTLDHEKAPSSWSPSVREKWKDLPQEVRAEVIRREEASVNGVRKLHEDYAPYRNFADRLTPFIQEATQSGADPAQYIANVMNSERGLRNPDPKQRFEVLLNIAEQYGIPLRDIVNQSAGSEVIAPRAQPTVDPQVQRELQEMRQFRQETHEAAIRRELEVFSSDKEFFQDVSSIMADFMDSGRAKNLQDAYEQACWVHPDVRKVLIERERTGKKTSDIKDRQKAASGATVRASGAADITVEDESDDSIEAIVRRSMTEASGRI